VPSKTQRSGCPKRVDHSGAVLENGGVDGYAVWKRILRAVQELRRMEPATDAPVQ